MDFFSPGLCEKSRVVKRSPVPGFESPFNRKRGVYRTNPGLITPGTRNTWYFNDDVQTPGIYGDPRCPTEHEFFARATRLSPLR